MSPAVSILEGGSTTVALTGAADPSIVDLVSLRYFFSLNQSTRNGATYALSSTSNSQTIAFADNGTYIVYGRVIDEDEGFSDYQTTITVGNVAPTATISAPTTIQEGDSTVITLSNGADVSTVDASSLRYFFSTSLAARNSSTYSTSLPANSQSFTFGLNGVYTVYARVVDKDNGYSDYQTTVTVDNAAPTATISAPVTLTEGSSTTVSLINGSDPSGADPALLKYFFSLSLTARNASTYTTSSFANSQAFSFADNGTYIVYARVLDADGGKTDYQTTVTVNNVAPTATISPAASILEGGSTTISLTGANDPSSIDAASLKYFFSTSATARNAATYGSSGSANNATFTFGDNGTNVVYARIIDKDGGRTDYQTTITVNNVAPTPTIVSISSPRVTGTPIAVVGSATDPALTNDTITYAWSVFLGSSSTPSFTVVDRAIRSFQRWPTTIAFG